MVSGRQPAILAYSFPHQFLLKFRQDGKNSEDECAVCGRGINLSTLADEALETNAVLGEVMGNIGQVLEITP